MKKYVNPIYKTKIVKDYIDDLILNGNVESISDVTYSDRCVLSGLLLKNEPLTEILNFISQNGRDEKFKELVVLCLVKDRDKDYKEMCADYLIEFAVDYYEPMIESILNERLQEIKE